MRRSRGFAAGRMGVLLWLSLAALASGSRVGSQPIPPLPEYRAKAAFLYNFARFVDWPSNAFQDQAAPVVIGIVGRDPFGPELDETLEGKTVHGRGIIVRRFARVPERDPCHILFIGPGADGRRAAGPIKRTGILTVGEDADGTPMIRLVSDEGRIRFEVDLPAVQGAGLTISSRLLRVGKLVGPGRK